MLCIKCKKEIAEDSTFCNYCGKKQTTTKKPRTHKRVHGTGTIRIDKRNKKAPYCAYGPGTICGMGRDYIGSYPTYAEAQQAIDDYIKKGRPALYGITVEGIYNLWSSTHYNTISDGSAHTYKASWKHFEGIKDMKMSDVRTAHLQGVIDDLWETPGAAYSARVLAKALCLYAMKNDLIDKNYAQFVTLPKAEKKEKVIFTEKDIAVLWEHSDDEKIQNILVMIYMGFRVGEVLDLKVDNINLDEGYIIGGEKTEAGKDRTVPFPSKIPEIREYVERWVENADPSGKLFPMCYQTFRVTDYYAPLMEIGIVDGYINEKYKPVFNTEVHITPHSTRHTFATKAVQAGMKPKELQKIIGHAKIQTTLDIYTHTDSEALKSEMSKLEKNKDSA